MLGEAETPPIPAPVPSSASVAEEAPPVVLPRPLGSVRGSDSEVHHFSHLDLLRHARQPRLPSTSVSGAWTPPSLRNLHPAMSHSHGMVGVGTVEERPVVLADDSSQPSTAAPAMSPRKPATRIAVRMAADTPGDPSSTPTAEDDQPTRTATKKVSILKQVVPDAVGGGGSGGGGTVGLRRQSMFPGRLLSQGSLGEVRTSTVGAFKWGLMKHLLNEGILVYSLRERDHVRVQAELRNSSGGQVRKSGDGWSDRTEEANAAAAGASLPWFLIFEDSKYRRMWNMFLSVLIVYSVIVVPYRLGFQAEATGAWFALVRGGLPRNRTHPPSRPPPPRRPWHCLLAPPPRTVVMVYARGWWLLAAGWGKAMSPTVAPRVELQGRILLP
jgi:hypothetical protein